MFHKRTKSLPESIAPFNSRKQSAGDTNEQPEGQTTEHRWQVRPTVKNIDRSDSLKKYQFSIQQHEIEKKRQQSIFDALIKEELAFKDTKADFRIRRKANNRLSGPLGTSSKIVTKAPLQLTRNSMDIKKADQYYQKLMSKITPFLTQFQNRGKRLTFTHFAYKEESQSTPVRQLPKNSQSLRKEKSSSKLMNHYFQRLASKDEPVKKRQEFKGNLKHLADLEETNLKFANSEYLLDMKIEESKYRPQNHRTAGIFKRAFEKYKDLVNSGIDPIEVVET